MYLDPEGDRLGGDDGEEGDVAIQRVPLSRGHWICCGRHPRPRLPPLRRKESLLARVPAHPGKNTMSLFLSQGCRTNFGGLIIGTRTQCYEKNRSEKLN